METKKDYSRNNAEPVLERLEGFIHQDVRRPIRDIYDELSIFDWWPEYLTPSHMKQMRTFLRLAIELGYTGYVCFKVGASGCANGMWAHKKESTDGYSPDGDFLYRSFTPDYTYYSIKHNDKHYPDDDNFDKCNSIDELKRLHAMVVGVQ